MSSHHLHFDASQDSPVYQGSGTAVSSLVLNAVPVDGSTNRNRAQREDVVVL